MKNTGKTTAGVAGSQTSSKFCKGLYVRGIRCRADVLLCPLRIGTHMDTVTTHKHTQNKKTERKKATVRLSVLKLNIKEFLL